MAGRGPQTYKKRQKELQRKERQQEKAARRMQRKQEKLAGTATESEPETDADDMNELDGEQVSEAEEARLLQP